MDYNSKKMEYNMNSDDDFDGNVCGYGTDNNGNSQSKNPNGLSKAELRRSNKPIMEKRRRARINHCLNELKSLILEAMKKDPARHTKLEKADILEMTVKHLQSIQRRQLSMAIQTDPTVIHKFKTGFVECAEEVKRYIGQLDSVDTGTRQRLSSYLNNCANSLEQIGSFTNFSNAYRSQTAQTFGGVPTLASQMPLPVPHDANNNGRVQMGGVNLIPSLLPSGEFALIMPTANANVIKPTINEPTAAFSVPTISTPNVDFSASFTRTSAFSKPSNKMPYPPPSYNDLNSSVPTSATATSPPLSPISSISSHEDDSLMHTSSDFASRSITPPLDGSRSSFSGVFSTPSSAESSKVYAHTPETQQAMAPSEAVSSSKRFNPYASGDSSDGPTPKRMHSEKQHNTDGNGNVRKEQNVEEGCESMWRPW